MDDLKRRGTIAMFLRIIKQELRSKDCIQIEVNPRSLLNEIVSQAMKRSHWKAMFSYEDTLSENKCSIALDCNLLPAGENLAFKILKNLKIRPPETIISRSKYLISKPMSKEKSGKATPLDFGDEWKYDRIVIFLDQNIRSALDSIVA